MDLIVGTIRSRFELCVAVKRNVAMFRLDMTTDLPLCGGRERYPRSVRIFFRYSVKSRLVDEHCVRHTVTKIHHEARRPSRNVQDKRARHVHSEPGELRVP